MQGEAHSPSPGPFPGEFQLPEVLGQGMKGNLSRLRSHELPVRSIGCVWPIPATKIRASFKRGHLVQDSKKEKRVKVRRTEMQDPVLSPLYLTQVPLSNKMLLSTSRFMVLCTKTPAEGSPAWCSKALSVTELTPGLLILPRRSVLTCKDHTSAGLEQRVLFYHLLGLVLPSS